MVESYQNLSIHCYSQEIKSVSNGCQECISQWRTKEKVYGKQPSGFIDPKYHDHFNRLDKALYILKQSPGAWYETLAQFLLEHGFTRGTIDKLYSIEIMVKTCS